MINKIVVIVIAFLLSYGSAFTQGGIDIIIPPTYIPCADWNDPMQQPSPNCKNVGCNNPQAQWQQGQVFVTLPDWPSCFFGVWFCYRVCDTYPNHTVQVHVYYWHQATKPCDDCDNFNDWLNDDYVTNVQQMTLLLWEKITLQLYQDFIEDLEDQNELYLAYCPNNKTEYYSTKGACKSTCIYQVLDGPDNYTVTEQVECNQGSCCVYSRKYCVDPFTQEVVIEGTTFHEDILDELNSCDSQQQVQFSTECYNGFNMVVKPCQVKCAEPEE